MERMRSRKLDPVEGCAWVGPMTGDEAMLMNMVIPEKPGDDPLARIRRHASYPLDDPPAVAPEEEN